MVAMCPPVAWVVVQDKGTYEINTAYSYEKDYICNNYKSFQLTACDSTTRTMLLPEVEEVYHECRNNGWANSTREKSKGIIKSSYQDIQEFVSYLKDFEILPSVVPFKNGCLGLEWNHKDKTVDIMFSGDNKFIYSIITNDTNEYGENTQTEENQINFIKRISGILTNA